MKGPPESERRVLRELARQYRDLCDDPVQEERRALWRRHNSLEKTRPMVLCLWWANLRELVDPFLECADPEYRACERSLRRKLFQAYTDDDTVAEPWLALPAVREPGSNDWGIKISHVPSSATGGAWQNIPGIRDPEDAERMVKPCHRIDEQATERKANRLREAIGDILPVIVDRSPACSGMANAFGRFRGIEAWMMDMIDRPAWLHKVMAFMRDAILDMHVEAEQRGDWRACNHTDALPAYTQELPPPSADPKPLRRKELFGWFNAQELTGVSPAMHEEFMLQYQRPIISAFGTAHYGCCEDLTHKIAMLRTLPNLRRIAVTPWADLGRCVEQIGRDYIISWQPNPAEMVCVGFDAARIRAIARAALERMRGCHVDIVLKDVQTVEGHPERLRDWSHIMRREAETWA